MPMGPDFMPPQPLQASESSVTSLRGSDMAEAEPMSADADRSLCIFGLA
jgi:hypothetical protein